MKTLLTITTFVFTLMLSSTSFAEWTEVSSNMGEQNTYFVDFERIRKHDGFVYFWSMSNYPIPIKGVSSEINLRQGDCKLFRYKIIDGSFYNKPIDKRKKESKHKSKRGMGEEDRVPTCTSRILEGRSGGQVGLSCS